MFDLVKAAEASKPELIEALRRIGNGEPFNPIAAELGLTPSEMQEMFDVIFPVELAVM
jgi:hypothetical protein